MYVIVESKQLKIGSRHLRSHSLAVVAVIKSPSVCQSVYERLR